VSNFKEEQTVTREEVARAAGVGTGTVSRVLSGKGSVKPATRARVAQVAEDLGYRPNAVASLLAQQRRRPRGASQRLKIAYLGPNRYQDPYLEEASELAGVDTESFVAGDFGDLREALRILWHRGVQGLMLNLTRFPWSEEEARRADWSGFAVVKHNRIYPSLRFHVVRHSPFDYMTTALRRIIDRGYRKIAVLLLQSGSDQDDHARLGAVLAANELLKRKGGEILWHIWSGTGPDFDPVTDSWLRAQKPDAVLAYVWPMLDELALAGWKFPKDVAAATVYRPVGNADWRLPPVSGCDPAHGSILARSISALKQMIARGEYGFPAIQNEFVVEPTWFEGELLPERSLGSETGK